MRRNNSEMHLKRKLMQLTTELVKTGIQLFGPSQAPEISYQLAQELTPIVSQKCDIGTILFFCPGRLPLYRARTLLTKEPETIEWIKGCTGGEVLWDIGACVGVYSLYAALKGLKVVSFEPQSVNYFLLNKNIEINKMDDKISAYCIAFSDKTKLNSFYMKSTEGGSAGHAFGQLIDWEGKKFTPVFVQGMIGFNIDDFISVFSPPFPNHIKIDVDGIEEKVVKGALNTLADLRLNSLLVEIDNEENSKNIISLIESHGLKFCAKRHASQFDKGKHSSVYNYIFRRD